MKRTLLPLILIMIFLSTPVSAAVDISDLPLEKQNEYLARFLSIRTEKVLEVHTDAFVFPGYYGVYTEWSTGNTLTTWQPYQGSAAISKTDFLYLTGQDALAAELQSEYDRARKLNTAGYVFFGIGVAGLVGSLIYELTANSSSSSISTPFMIASGISTAVSCIGIPLMAVRPNENISVSFAVNIADLYNQQLYESIR